MCQGNKPRKAAEQFVAVFDEYYRKRDKVGIYTCAALINSINDLYRAVANLVIARCGGESTMGKAHGFSIYLPPGEMELSYCNSIFARYSQWPFLVSMLRFVEK